MHSSIYTKRKIPIQLIQFRIPRWSGYSNPTSVTELVGFSDASDDAVIYSRVKASGEYIVRLIAANGRVTESQAAPRVPGIHYSQIKLENVILLTELCRDVKRSSRTIPTKLFAYTDSEVALACFRSQKKFENKVVKRRVWSIRKMKALSQIHHARSK